MIKIQHAIIRVVQKYFL